MPQWLGLRLYYGSEWAAQGVFTVFSILFIFVGVQLLAMGMLGEYIGRIYTDVRARPRYFVREVVLHSEPGDTHAEPPAPVPAAANSLTV